MEERFISRTFLFVLLGTTLLLFRLFWSYLSAIVLALLIASAFYPLYSRVKKAFNNREICCALLMTLLILLVLIIPVGWFVGTLSNEALDFYARTRDSVSLKEIQEGLQGDSLWAQRVRRLGELTGMEINPETVERMAGVLGRNVGLYLSRQISSVASNLLNFLVHFFLMMVVIYYIFREGVRLRDYISDLLPFPVGQQETVVSKFREMARALIFGNGANAIIQGMIGGLGFYLFDLGSPFLWGTVIGFMAFLPIIGSSIVFLPAAAILVIRGEGLLTLGFLTYNIAYSSIMEYLIKPRLIGKGMRMNPLLVFIGILGGIKIFGIMGIIYGPLIITIFLTLAEIYREEYKEIMC